MNVEFQENNVRRRRVGTGVSRGLEERHQAQGHVPGVPSSVVGPIQYTLFLVV